MNLIIHRDTAGPKQTQDSSFDEHIEHDESLNFFDLRFGRGEVFLGVWLLFLGFFMPLLTVHRSVESSTRATALALASNQAPNLWMEIVAALSLWVILRRRRTLTSMRGARLAIPMLGILASLSLGYTLFRVHHASALRSMTVSLQWGAYMLAIGALLIMVGGIRFGVPVIRTERAASKENNDRVKRTYTEQLVNSLDKPEN